MGFLDAFNFSRMSKKEAPPRLQPTSPAISQRIRNILGIRELEAMPAQAARAFQLSSDPRATAADFIKVIESDEALSARVIRIANSVYYFRGSPAKDIEKAVANIGLDELRCLLSATLLRSLVRGQGSSARGQVWANSVGSAVCARMLSRYSENVTSGEAFLCGLVHDVGKLVMIRRCSELYEQVFQLLAVGELSTLDAEERIFELNHVEVGKWVAESWSFPPSALLSIIHHHDPWPCGAPTRQEIPLPLLVKAADTIAHATGIGHTVSLRRYAKRIGEQLPNAFQLFGLSTSDGEKFIESFKKQFDTEFGRYELEAH